MSIFYEKRTKFEQNSWLRIIAEHPFSSDMFPNAFSKCLKGVKLSVARLASSSFLRTIITFSRLKLGWISKHFEKLKFPINRLEYWAIEWLAGSFRMLSKSWYINSVWLITDTHASFSSKVSAESAKQRLPVTLILLGNILVNLRMLICNFLDSHSVLILGNLAAIPIKFKRWETSSSILIV